MGNEKDTFGQAISDMLKTYGTDILENTQRVNAILMDYVPRRTRERKLIILALGEGIGSDLLTVCGKNKQEQQLCINRCVRCLIEESWVAEEAAQFVVDVLAIAIGINNTKTPQDRNSAVQLQTDNIKELEKGACVSEEADLTTFLNQYQILGYKAFAANHKITELELPQSIKTIKSDAFINCINLKRITLPTSIEEIGKGVFDGCDLLESISIQQNPNYVVVCGMLIDKKNKVLMRATKTVAARCVIPREVTTIQARAFERSEIQTVILSRNLSELSQAAFSFCEKLQRFDIDSHNEQFISIDGVLHTKDRSQLVRFPSGYIGVNYIIEDAVSHIVAGAFCGTVNIETITFTGNLRSIGSRAFEYCRKLSSLVLPNGVEIIGERAFQYCDHLCSIMLPWSIQEIGDHAFCGCKSIQTVSVPKQVKRIGHAAFKDCSSLKKVIIQDSVEFIGDGVFVGCAKNLEISIKDNNYVERYCSAHKITWSAL